MSIQKNTPHFLRHSGFSFTTILNQTIELIKDPGALGIYVYLASKHNGWIINEDHLQTRFGKGRDYIRARMADLKRIGLIQTVAIKDQKGRIIRWETTVLSHIPENPSSGEFDHDQVADHDHQITENPESGKTRYLENPPYINKRDIKIKEDNKPPISPEGDEEGVDDQSPFGRFWKAYPVRKAKKRAHDIWKRKKLDKYIDKIITAIHQQIADDDEWSRGYIPHPSTYLNQERWTDEIKISDTAKSLRDKEKRIQEANRLAKEREKAQEQAAAQRRLENKMGYDPKKPHVGIFERMKKDADKMGV